MNIDKCYELLKKYETPLEVVTHGEKVMETAVNLANIYNKAGNISLDVNKIRSAALLHDIAKSHPKHALLGQQWVGEEGYPEIGEIIGNHMKIKDNLTEAITEASIVYLSDKQVKGTKRVPIKERFIGKIEKLYACGNTGGAKGAEGRYNAALLIQKQFVAETSIALIVAAGMSSRMGDFKPTLKLEDNSIAKRVVENFRNAGIRDIVMVVGNNGDLLKEHLAGLGIKFVENENYQTTDMFYSVKLGLSYIKKKSASQVFFTPIDVPLFSQETVATLGSYGGQVCLPAYKGKTGHPILINTDLIDSILAYNGEMGLKGAVDNLGVRDIVEVEDKEILIDIDTKDDYISLLERTKNHRGDKFEKSF